MKTKIFKEQEDLINGIASDLNVSVELIVICLIEIGIASLSIVGEKEEIILKTYMEIKSSPGYVLICEAVKKNKSKSV